MISLDYSVGNLEDTFISSKMEQQKKLETSQAFFDRSEERRVGKEC